MSSLRIRPRFSQEVSFSIAEIEAIVQEHLQESDIPCIGKISQGYIVLKVLPEERHFWSPELTLSLDEVDEGVKINGLYGPNPSVWAMFFYSYVILGLLSVFAGIFGFAFWSLGKTSVILWLVPVFVGLGIILYFIAQAGQKIGAEQMFTLHHFYEESIGKRVHIH